MRKGDHPRTWRTASIHPSFGGFEFITSKPPFLNLLHRELRCEAVKLALSRSGDLYSQLKAGQGNYTDCSYLAQWCLSPSEYFHPPYGGNTVWAIALP